MRSCPWCGHENLNVYAYCQACGRGWAGPPWEDDKKAKERAEKPSPWRKFWPFGRRAA